MTKTIKMFVFCTMFGGLGCLDALPSGDVPDSGTDAKDAAPATDTSAPDVGSSDVGADIASTDKGDATQQADEGPRVNEGTPPPQKDAAGVETAADTTAPETETSTDSGSIETTETSDACVPDCLGRMCGPDGCGGSCGTCPVGPVVSGCQGQNILTTMYTGECNIPSGSNPAACETTGFVGTACEDGFGCTVSTCEGEGGAAHCVHTPSTASGCAATPCVPSCSGKECGGDGCGGTCGSCTDGDLCSMDSCVAGTCTYVAKICDDGNANTADMCDPVTGACKFSCVPSCVVGKVCGDDGCGGVCGSCLAGLVCDLGSGKCLAPGQCTVSGQCGLGEICFDSLCATDTDWDGVPDGLLVKDNCPTVANSDQKDSDLDGAGDVCDCAPLNYFIHPGATELCSTGVDEDCDGLKDEGCPPDADLDGVPDSFDNCPNAANPTQADLNKDGWGEVCELAASVWIVLPSVVHRLSIQGWLCVGGTNGIGCKAWTPWADMLTVNGVFADGFDLLGLGVSLVQPPESELFFDYRVQVVSGGPAIWLCDAPPEKYTGPLPYGPNGKPFGIVPNGQGGCNFVRKM